MAINQQENGSNGSQNENFRVKNHEKRHTNKTFECFECDKKFQDEKDLMNHEDEHEKPHKCEKCDKKFLFSWALKKHEKAHKNFKCCVCGKRFELQGQLKSHEGTHTREKSFNCTQCEYPSSVAVFDCELHL